MREPNSDAAAPARDAQTAPAAPAAPTRDAKTAPAPVPASQTAPRPEGDNPSLEEIAAYFENDKFAMLAGCTIVEGACGHAICEMPITEEHLNAQGGVMGGAIFTLADFALAVASNVGESPTVLVSSDIDFMSASKGTKLIATCDVDKSGSRLGFYRVSIVDDTGRAVARLVATCAHL